MAAALPSSEPGNGAFRDEGDLLVYTSPAQPAPGEDTEWFFDEIARRGHRRLLVDVRKSPGMDQDARRAVYRRHHELDGRRIAVIGSRGFQEFIVAFLLAATGHAGARYFHDEAEARTWLRGEADDAA